MTSDKLVVQRTTSFYYWSGPFLSSVTRLYTPYTKAGLTLSSFNKLVLYAAEKAYVVRFRKS